MIDQWPKVGLGTLLTRNCDSITPSADRNYQEITVRLWGKGVVLRGTISGSEISGQRRFVAHAGELILSRIDARHGAIGMVPQELDGALVTNDFPLYRIAVDRIVPSYLAWLCRTASFVEECKRVSEGTTNRVRLPEHKLLNIEIPLPSVAEQLRVVAHIDSIDTLVSEALTLHAQVQDEMNDLCRAIIRSDKDARLVSMSELVRVRAPDVTVEPNETYQFAGVYSFGKGVFRGNAKSGSEFAYPKLTRIRSGDFVYPKLMAWEGALGVVPQACDGCVVSTEFPVFEVREEMVLPEVLDVHFRSPSVWPELSGSSTGTNVRRRRLNPSDFLAYRLPVPSRTVQLHLREVMANLREAERLQVEGLAEYKAIMPSVLKNAFSRVGCK